MKAIPTQFRKKAMAKLNAVLKDAQKSAEIERNVHEFYVHATKNTVFGKNKTNIAKNIYMAKFRQIYNLVKEGSYLGFTVPVDDDEFLKDIAFKHYKLLCPSKWALYKRDLEILDGDKVQNTNVQTTDAFKCPGCGQNKCVYTEVQTRSADESATVFVKCTHCNKSFRG